MTRIEAVERLYRLFTEALKNPGVPDTTRDGLRRVLNLCLEALAKGIIKSVDPG